MSLPNGLPLLEAQEISLGLNEKPGRDVACSQTVLLLLLQQRGGEMRYSRLPYGACHVDR